MDSGPNARSIQLALPRFTLIGATTRAGLLSSPLRSRFGITNRLDYYDADLLYRIIQRSAKILDIEIDNNGGKEIAQRSRNSTNSKTVCLRCCRDFAEADESLKHHKRKITFVLHKFSASAGS